MGRANVVIEERWKEVLEEEFTKDYFKALTDFLKKQKSQGKTIYPPGSLIFNAFALTPFDKVRVVIIGQDPYHNPGEAMGLSFSVPKGVRIPPSLRNIYRELSTSTGFTNPGHGDLTAWAAQGVLLLNAILTVEKNAAASHNATGWQLFTDAAIKQLSERKENLVFLLWGKFAASKQVLIDQTKHHVLIAAHPSPLARDAFQGCGHFTKTNELLTSMNTTPINWQL